MKRVTCVGKSPAGDAGSGEAERGGRSASGCPGLFYWYHPIMLRPWCIFLSSLFLRETGVTVLHGAFGCFGALPSLVIAGLRFGFGQLGPELFRA